MTIITIAFDDGYKDTFDHCAAFLTKRGIKATFSVASRYIGKTQENRPVISKEDINSLIRSGHEIASHSATHMNLVELLNKVGEAGVRNELNESKKALSDITHGKIKSGKIKSSKIKSGEIKSFVFPFIDNNNNELLRKMSGEYYTSSRITSEHPFFNPLPVKDPFSITGTAIKKDITLEELNNLSDTADKTRNTWLIEVYHLVSNINTKSAHRDEAYRFFTHIDIFKKHVEYLIERKITILTQKEAVERFYAKI